MPFDYESFITGVITGLKLGRPPQGRITPPISDSYIITEDGDEIITESGENIVTE